MHLVQCIIFTLTLFRQNFAFNYNPGVGVCEKNDPKKYPFHPYRSVLAHLFEMSQQISSRKYHLMKELDGNFAGFQCPEISKSGYRVSPEVCLDCFNTCFTILRKRCPESPSGSVAIYHEGNSAQGCILVWGADFNEKLRIHWSKSATVSNLEKRYRHLETGQRLLNYTGV